VIRVKVRQVCGDEPPPLSGGEGVAIELQGGRGGIRQAKNGHRNCGDGQRQEGKTDWHESD
jgi:hypothetical protein